MTDTDRLISSCFHVDSYYGSGVTLGDCGISILKASMSDTGIWSCHMGTTDASAVEASKDINVRISGWSFHQLKNCL